MKPTHNITWWYDFIPQIAQYAAERNIDTTTDAGFILAVKLFLIRSKTLN